MFFELKSYLSFLMKSTNQHGVHSPSVFDLTTNCLYAKFPTHLSKKKINKKNQLDVDTFFIKHPLKNKKERLLRKIMLYFNVKTGIEIVDLHSSNTLKSITRGLNTQIKKINTINAINTVSDTELDVVFIHKTAIEHLKLESFNNSIQNMPNESFLILDNIHANHKVEKKWNYVKNHDKVTVSIDLYYFGIVFFRKEQEKEHFIIRV